MCSGIKFSGIKVSNDLICDGHHRYIASILANCPIERIPGMITSSTLEVPWESVTFNEEDWDTSAKINMLNEQDAVFNGFPMDKIIELLK